MKKILKIIVIFVSLVVCIPIVYAKTSQVLPVKEPSFFEINTNEVQAGDTIAITIDLSKIETTKFEFILSSNVELNEMDSKNQEIEMDSNNQISFVIDKEESNLEKIELSYVVSKEISIGTEIIFKAEVKDLNNDTEDIEEILQQAENKIKVVENKNENDESSSNIQNGNSNSQVDELVDMNNASSNKAPSTTMQTTKTSQSSGTSNMSSVTTVTYNGSYDNYLSNLEVTGYEITPEFSKTNQTYFLTVENDVEEIKINYDCSDSTAKVSIYGNTSLKEGENKILINVTAENGSVRTYRIYVTRQS